MKTVTFTIAMPQAGDDLGRWLDENGGHISIDCMLGIYHVCVSWRRLHSYSDERGMHREEWEVTRHDRELPKALTAALTEAMKQTSNSKLQGRTATDSP